MPAKLVAPLVRFTAWLQRLRLLRAGPGWLAICLYSHAVLATPPGMADYGAARLVYDPGLGAIATSSCGREYYTPDGGLSWLETARPVFPSDAPAELPEEWTLSDPADPQVVYRFRRGKSIERSRDGGATWIGELRLEPLSAGQIDYHDKSTYACVSIVLQGPLSALIDPATGNLVVGMGHEGVLVRLPEGEYRWAPVGGYARAGRYDPGVIAKATLREMLAAASLAGFTLLAAGLLKSRRAAWLLPAAALQALYLLWLAGTRRDVIFLPAASAGGLPFGLSLLYIVSLAVSGWRLIIRSGPQAAWRTALYGALSGLAGWLPFLVWSLGSPEPYPATGGPGFWLVFAFGSRAAPTPYSLAAVLASLLVPVVWGLAWLALRKDAPR